MTKKIIYKDFICTIHAWCCSGTTNSNYVIVTYFIKFLYHIEFNDSDDIFFEQENFFTDITNKSCMKGLTLLESFIMIAFPFLCLFFLIFLCN